MAYRVEVSARARRDLEALYEFIHAEESDHAFAWFNGLAETLRSLAKLPYRAPLRRERQTLRHLLYGSKPHIYRILYTIDERAKIVYVAQIRHGARRSLRPHK